MREIAKALGRKVSTIWYEVKSNSVNGRYSAKKADLKAGVRRQNAKYQGMKIVASPGLRQSVEKKLREGRSPESIAGRINQHEQHVSSISADSIRRFLKSVYGRKIESFRKTLLIKQKRRHKRSKANKLKDRTFIDKRPKIIAKRGRVGDSEADFIVSGKSGEGYILTVEDRKLRVSFLEPVLPVTIENMEKAFLRIKERYPELRTITTDNDLLFACHKRLAKLLNVKIYFCYPYHSWEKGAIENVNGEIRKYIPKGSDLSKYSLEFLRSIEQKLNDRYMECLKYFTPQEMLDTYRARKKRANARLKNN